MPGLGHSFLHRRDDGAFHNKRDLLSNPLGAAGSILNDVTGDGGSSNNNKPQVSVVFVTASIPSSLQGQSLQWSTVGVTASASSDDAKPTTSSEKSKEAKTTDSPSSSPTDSSSSASPSSTVATTTAAPTSLSQSPATSTPSSASIAATTTAAAEAADAGLSGGAKAGIAFAVILGVAALAGAAFFFWKRKQLQNKPTEMSEKVNPMPMAPALAQAPAQFPQRPASPPQPMPMAFATPPAFATPVANPAPAFGASRDIERADNPFGSQYEIPPSAPGTSHGPPAPAELTAAATPAPQQAPTSPQNGLPAALRVSSAKVSDADKAALAGVGTAAAVGVAAAAVASGRKSAETAPASPTYSTGSGIAGGHEVKNTVHRVQLDFKPSMDDELELLAGNLVRLVHEYDDGWALCVRMDGGAQGVAPRTCLSASPVKPRPPPGPGQGPPGPRMPMQRPDSPAGRSPGARNLIPNNGMQRPSGPNSPNRGPGPFAGPMGPPRAGSPAMNGPGMRNGPPRAGSPGPGMMNGPPRSMSPGPGMRNGPPRAMSPGPGMSNGPPRAMSPGPGMRNGPPRAGSPGPRGPGGPGPMMPAAQRQRSNSSSGMQPEQRQAPGPSPMGAGSPKAGSNPTSPKISRKPVGADS